MMNRKIYFAIALLVVAAGCKKEDSNPPGCEITVAAIAGNYKLTKLMASASGVNTDITSTVDSCELNALYQLQPDKTLLYTESGTCLNSATGTWDIISGRITASAGAVNFADDHIDNSCTYISVTQYLGGAAYITVFTRQ